MNLRAPAPLIFSCRPSSPVGLLNSVSLRDGEDHAEPHLP